MSKTETQPPKLPYDLWRALGPEKAAEYLARRHGYSAQRQGKLWAVLEFAWHGTEAKGAAKKEAA
jgi:hypothetical protein